MLFRSGAGGVANVGTGHSWVAPQVVVHEVDHTSTTSAASAAASAAANTHRQHTKDRDVGGIENGPVTGVGGAQWVQDPFAVPTVGHRHGRGRFFQNFFHPGRPLRFAGAVRARVPGFQGRDHPSQAGSAWQVLVSDDKC